MKLTHEELLKTPDKKLWPAAKRKKKILKFLLIKEIAAPKRPVHPKTGMIRLAIVKTTPTRYGRMVSIGHHTYVSKWSNSHTIGGTSIHSKELVNPKKGVRNVSSYGMN